MPDEITEEDIIEERRVPEHHEVANILALYFDACGPDVADRLHAEIVALAADRARRGPALSSFRANSRRYFGRAWKETLSRERSSPRLLDMVVWIATTQPGYPAAKPYCPAPLVGQWYEHGYSWRLDADGTATIDNPTLVATRRWSVHRHSDSLLGDAVTLYDDVGDERALCIEEVAPVLRVQLLDNARPIFALHRETMRGPARTILEMGFAVSMTACPSCGRHDLTRVDIHGEGTIWTLAGHCAGCDGGRTESFRTTGDPYKTPHPMGEIGEGPTLMFAAEELRSELARIWSTLKTDPTSIPRDRWPVELASNRHAMTAATELRKLVPTDDEGERAFARHLAVLRAYEAERDGTTPAPPTSIGELGRTSMRAHDAWLANGRTGPGRLVLAHISMIAEKIGNVQLIAAKLDGVTLDRSGLAYASFEEAELTDVTFISAVLESATFTKATITGGSFINARLAVSDFDGATISGTEFSASDLERSDWMSARVTRAGFAGARFGNARFDGATFTACDFHQASFAMLQSSPLPTTAARFEDCDLRDTDWTARSLDHTTFVRCKLAGAHGTPSSRTQLVVEDCDVPADQFCSEKPATMQWLVESPRNDRVATAAVAALGADARIHRGPASSAPAIRIRFVFASDLAGYLATSPNVRACEQTILVNAERFEVLELLEAHDLGGAIECEEHGSWTAYDARMFVRKEAIDLESGTVIGGPGRESEHYVLWTHPDPTTRTCRLADLVRECAGALSYFATRRDELLITAEEARQHSLPAIRMRMTIGHVGLVPTVFPQPGWYVRFESPPGGMVVFDIRVCDDLDPAAVARAFGLTLAGTEDVQLAGATRVAVLCVTGGDNEMMRMGWCLVPIQHATGRFVVRLAARLPVGEVPSWAGVMGFAGLRILSASFAMW